MHEKDEDLPEKAQPRRPNNEDGGENPGGADKERLERGHQDHIRQRRGRDAEEHSSGRGVRAEGQTASRVQAGRLRRHLHRQGLTTRRKSGLLETSNLEGLFGCRLIKKKKQILYLACKGQMRYGHFFVFWSQLAEKLTRTCSHQDR